LIKTNVLPLHQIGAAVTRYYVINIIIIIRLLSAKIDLPMNGISEFYVGGDNVGVNINE